MGDTLKDFLVGIGFKVDDSSRKAADAAIDKTEAKATKVVEKGSSQRSKLEKKEAVERQRRANEAAKKEQERQSKSLKSLELFAKRATGLFAADAIIKGIEKIGSAVDAAAAKFERLNYTSMLSGSSAGGVSAFGYAASQLGANRQDAEAQLTAFGQKLKTNATGYESVLKRLHVRTREANGSFRETADIATDLGDALRQQRDSGPYGYATAQNYAKTLGFDGMPFQALMRPEFRGYEGQQKGDGAKVGTDQNAAAASGTAFEQSMRHLSEVLDQIHTKIDTVLFQKLKPLLDQLSAWFVANGDKIADIVGRLAEDLVKLATAIGEQLAAVDWKTVLTGFESLGKSLGVLLGKLSGDGGLVAMILGLTVAMRGLALLSMPPWALALLGVGVGAVAGKAADAIIDYKAEAAAMPKFEAEAELGKHHLTPRGGARRAFDWLKGKAGFGDGSASGNDAIWARGRRAKALRDKANGYGPTDAPTGAPGQYRPQYKLGDADLSDAVVNTIAGEANNNQESTDAVINNMLNRVGTSTYGPSRNLNDVARAPGQYAGYRKASQAQADYIRSRIKAIASGAVADNTKGSNEYRASWYNGPWARQHLEDGAVVGGNRFAYNPKGGRGPFAPYPEGPRKLPPMAKSKPLGDAKPMVPGYVPGQAAGLKSGGYLSEGLDASGKPITLAPQHTSYRGDTNINHSPTFNISGGDTKQNLDAARLTASRGQQDLLRNVQGTLA